MAIHQKNNRWYVSVVTGGTRSTYVGAFGDAAAAVQAETDALYHLIASGLRRRNAKPADEFRNWPAVGSPIPPIPDNLRTVIVARVPSYVPVDDTVPADWGTRHAGTHPRRGRAPKANLASHAELPAISCAADVSSAVRRFGALAVSEALAPHLEKISEKKVAEGSTAA